MRRAGVSIIAGLIVLGCALQIADNPKPLVVWNVTASAPIGLYRRSFRAFTPGDWVLVKVPDQVARFAAQRGYVPANVPMVKNIAALGGATVCRTKGIVTVNGAVRAVALFQDTKGRRLPVWQGCHQLNSDQIFVLTAPPASFDGRYFGLLTGDNIVERIEPLWTF